MVDRFLFSSLFSNFDTLMCYRQESSARPNRRPDVMSVARASITLTKAQDHTSDKNSSTEILSSNAKRNQLLAAHHRIGGLVLGARLESGRSRYEPGLRWVLSGSSHTSDLNIGIPVATLPGAWCYRVSPGTGRPGVSVL